MPSKSKPVTQQPKKGGKGQASQSKKSASVTPSKKSASSAPSKKSASVTPSKKSASATPSKKKSTRGSVSGKNLGALASTDQLFIKQKVNLLETIVGFEENNKYAIMNKSGKVIYFAIEDSDCLTRQCCRGDRAFDIKILDARTQKEVIHVKRPFRCSNPTCCFCCLQVMSVDCPPGNLIGKVIQQCSCCLPKFEIVNVAGETVLNIKGPFCTQSCGCGDVDFQVLDKAGEKDVGKISKKWSGLVKEAFTDADNFGVTYPRSLSPGMKALMLSAAFLIDFMYFEDKNDDDR